MSELKRKKGESFEAFMRRVKRGWKSSGRILQARKIQYFMPAKSKNVRKAKAVRKQKVVGKLDYLRKIGKLPDDMNYSQR